jgi:hypothetical protein
VGTFNLRTFGFIGQELIDFRSGPVIDADLETVIIHIEDQVLSHHCEADQADVAVFCLHK